MNIQSRHTTQTSHGHHRSAEQVLEHMFEIYHMANIWSKHLHGLLPGLTVACLVYQLHEACIYVSVSSNKLLPTDSTLILRRWITSMQRRHWDFGLAENDHE